MDRKDDEMLVAVIGDEDTVAGFMLAGIEEKGGKKSNCMVVDSKTKKDEIEQKFEEFTSRNDIGIILITQSIADEIRYLISSYKQVLPTVLEIPSKDKPYDAKSDTMMARVKRLLGEA